MPDIWFESPEPIDPPTEVGRVFTVRIGWIGGGNVEVDGGAKIRLTADPVPYRIEPNDTMTLTLGEVEPGDATVVDFTVTYRPNRPTAPFSCTLRASLYPDGNTANPPSEVQTCTVKVTDTDSGWPPGGPGIALRSRRTPLLDADARTREDRAKADENDARKGPGGPIVLSGSLYPRGDDNPAASVVALVYRKPGGQLTIDAIAPAIPLARDLFVVTLDPDVAEVPNRSYRLCWVSQYGSILQTPTGTLS